MMKIKVGDEVLVIAGKDKGKMVKLLRLWKIKIKLLLKELIL